MIRRTNSADVYYAEFEPDQFIDVEPAEGTQGLYNVYHVTNVPKGSLIYNCLNEQPLPKNEAEAEATVFKAFVMNESGDGTDLESPWMTPTED